MQWGHILGFHKAVKWIWNKTYFIIVFTVQCVYCFTNRKYKNKLVLQVTLNLRSTILTQFLSLWNLFVCDLKSMCLICLHVPLYIIIETYICCYANNLEPDCRILFSRSPHFTSSTLKNKHTHPPDFTPDIGHTNTQAHTHKQMETSPAVNVLSC